MRMPIVPLLSAAVCLVVLVPWNVVGQTNQGAIRGTVVDESRGALPGVSVTVEAVGRDTSVTTTSNDDGSFAFMGLLPGNYHVAAELQGFGRAVAPDVVVYIGEVVRVDLVMRVGTLQESVTVGGARLTTPDTVAAGTVVTAAEFEKLPLAGAGRSRIPTDFALLTPGVLGGQQRPGRSHTATTSLSIDGGQNGSTDVLIDGMSGGQFQNFGSFTEVGIPAEAIQEFNVIKGIMPAEYGYVQTGLLSFSLKSGTNTIRGSAFNNFRHHALNAPSYFERDSEKLPAEHNNFGGTVSGPIYAGRTFFMLSYDYSRFRGTSAVQVYTSPTEAMLRGDFSELRTASGAPRAIYDPATGVSDGSGSVTRQPFPGNIIPVERMSPIARQIAALIPAPNRPGASANFVGRSGAVLLDNTFLAGKIDHRFSPRHSVSGSFNYTRLPRQTYGNPYEGTPLLTGLNQDISGRSGRIAYDFIISSDVINQLSFGYNSFVNNSSSFSKGGDWPTTLGLRGVGGDGSMPVVQFSSDNYPKMGLERWDAGMEQNFMLRNTTTMARNRHTVKFGFEMRSQRQKPRDWRNQAGTFTFSFRETALNGSSSTGNAFASFLLGYVDAATINTPLDATTVRPYYAGFIQDDIRLTPRLTLNLGLRYEVDLPPREQNDRASTFDLNTPNPGAGNLPGAMIFAGDGPGRAGRRTFENTYYGAWGPRLGLAYQVRDRTVLRLGYGVSHSSHGLLNTFAGFSSTQAFQSPDLGSTPAFLLDDGMPTNWQKPPFIDPTMGNGNNVSTTTDGAARMPRTQMWRVDVQQELARSLLFEAAYVGTRGTNLEAEALRNLNMVDPAYLSLGSVLRADIDSAAAQAAGIVKPYPGFTGTVAQALRPYPHVLNVTARGEKMGRSQYHAGQFKLQKRFSHGVQFLAAYTVSRLMTDVPSGLAGVAASSVQNPFDLASEWAIGAFDTPHAVALNASVNLPFGDGERWLTRPGVVNGLLGGWNVAIILNYQSGVPLRVQQNNQMALFNSAQRPNRVPGVAAKNDVSYGNFDPSVDRMLNIAAFTSAGANEFGDAPPRLADAREFGTRSEDLALRKTIRFGARVRSELNVQVFNLFNRPNWGTPNVNINSADFGRITTAGPARFVQLGVKFLF